MNSNGSLLMADRRLRSGRTGLEWRPAWIWPKAAHDLAAEQLAASPGPSLHVCCGSSRLGDLRVDLYHPSADVQADARQLPFDDGSFGTVLMDPPWTIADLRERQRFVTEAGRVLRDNGVFLLYAPWLPKPSWARLENAWVRSGSMYRMPSAPVLFTRWHRLPRSGRSNARDAAVATFARARDALDAERDRVLAEHPNHAQEERR